ncbi:amino acid ABC transporter permease [Martelella mediterranea]|uniref:Amino acid ABC transporter membrane protein 2 (PAAT family) n=1 Tax=Martelella mediterranea TaxID=293089 RepID=A0A4R3NIC4_9HYPH|nr:amino acid ABC transporter permease [Martelella mediterranea]TCT27706.1 amino acid ABC transporter membrane protein 2 (PAAT family) [Martelella mediterranea]
MTDLWLGMTSDDILTWLPELWQGFKISLQVTGLTLLLGIPLGLVFALAVQSKLRAMRWSVLALVEIGRGAPALVLIQFMYSGLPQAGLTLGSFSAAVAALGLSTAAYTSEIIRAGLQAVPAGQKEAAAVLRLGRLDTLRFVTLPQAIRIAVPGLLGFSILVLQSTSLCFTISLSEIISRAYDIGAITFQYFPVLMLAGLFFAAVCIPASILVSWFEGRAGAYAKR